MKFEALNWKDTFKVWKLSLFAVLIGFSLVALAFLTVEIPQYIQAVSSSVFGYEYFSNREMLSPIISVAVLLPIVDVGLFIVIRLCSKWEKDAARYGLRIDGDTATVLCEGQAVCIKVQDIDRFEVLPKNSEPTAFRSKWCDVGYIVSGEQTYTLYYLKNLQQAKMIVEPGR